ncbi:hypothetical protein BGZ63DRAFT_427116 [Mariannaea sp. PMI_226]|nr:hypothetical protein BGZ63DRAFT_427116 [Mariannaea sp. PMI_226]
MKVSATLLAILSAATMAMAAPGAVPNSENDNVARDPAKLCHVGAQLAVIIEKGLDGGTDFQDTMPRSIGYCVENYHEFLCLVTTGSLRIAPNSGQDVLEGHVHTTWSMMDVTST